MTASEVAELDSPPTPPSGAAGSMSQDQGRHSKRNGGARPPSPKDVDPAFEIWLNRGLHQLYDAVAKEPLPEELLKLIEEDRSKK